MKFLRYSCVGLILVLGMIALVASTPNPPDPGGDENIDYLQIIQDHATDPVLCPWNWAHWRPGIFPQDYKRLNMSEGPPEVWEDALRTDPDQPSFEWWYFDGIMSDGTTVVVVFYTKSMFAIDGPEKPTVTVSIVPPGASPEEFIYARETVSPEYASYSTIFCDVQIGENYCTGDLAVYEIYARIGDVEVDLTLQSTVPSYRSFTGYVFTGPNEEFTFAWLPAVPNGTLSGTMTYNGSTHHVQGSGYHDHNWGNTDASSIFKSWWWMRASVGPYTIISIVMKMKNKYGGLTLPGIILLDENGVVADMSSYQIPIFTQMDLQAHPDPNHDDTIAYTIGGVMRSWQWPMNDYVKITYNTPMDASALIESANILGKEQWPESQIALAKEWGYEPWYTRFLSTATLDFVWKGVSYQGTGPATVEFMDLE